MISKSCTRGNDLGVAKVLTMALKMQMVANVFCEARVIINLAMIHMVTGEFIQVLFKVQSTLHIWAFKMWETL